MDVKGLFFRRWAPCQSAVFGVCFTSSSVTICFQRCASLTIFVSAWTRQSTQPTCSCDVNTPGLFSRLHVQFFLFFFAQTCLGKMNVLHSKVCGGESCTKTQWSEMSQTQFNDFFLAFTEVVYSHCQCRVPKTHSSHIIIIALYRLRAEKCHKGSWISCLFLLFQAHYFVKAENNIINSVSVSPPKSPTKTGGSEGEV